jgi:hypothetical protein
MDRDGELHHAEPGAEVAAGDGTAGNHLLAKLVGELRQLLRPEAAQLQRRRHRVQQGRVRAFGHRKRPVISARGLAQSGRAVE